MIGVYVNFVIVNGHNVQEERLGVVMDIFKEDGETRYLVKKPNGLAEIIKPNQVKIFPDKKE